MPQHEPLKTPRPAYPPGFAGLAARPQTIWLLYKESGPRYSSPSELSSILGGPPQHYTQHIRALVLMGYLITTGRTSMYRGRPIEEHRVCTADEYCLIASGQGDL